MRFVPFFSVSTKSLNIIFSNKVDMLPESRMHGHTIQLFFTYLSKNGSILSGFYNADEKEKAEKFLRDVNAINNLNIKDVDLSIANEAAKIRAKYKIKLPDAMIASSCKIHKCKLITQDEHFKKLKEIEVMSIDKTV